LKKRLCLLGGTGGGCLSTKNNLAVFCGQNDIDVLIYRIIRV